MKLLTQLNQINKTWRDHLSCEINCDYMLTLEAFLEAEKEKGKTIFPAETNIFSAFDSTPLNKVRVVIIGQDPYHGDDQAHGMSFSVLPGVKIPPSLRNIYKELKSDLGISSPSSGHLIGWAKQGVLLLNTVLTVEKSIAASHQKKGWEQFTDKVIQVLNDECDDLVFLLWGSSAQKKAKGVDLVKHHILKTVHPSPLSAYRGFLGCKHFSHTNEILIQKGYDPIDWKAFQ
ncbi:MAG: uracil-DNA glycosylase [Bacteriovoracaceae bacterium]|nr:uracil-DNA glycosylase [Bacteriovoracaceae bacterium]